MNASSKDPKKQSPDSKGSGQQQQAQSGEGQQYGEGNYKGTRDYNRGLKDHVEHHDIEKEARDAAPKSASEEKEMEDAERIGKSKARGEDEGRADDAETEQ
jgi:hypothetical protein